MINVSFTANIDSPKGRSVRKAIIQNVTSTDSQVIESIIRVIQALRKKAYYYYYVNPTGRYWEKDRGEKYYNCTDTLLDFLMNEYKSCELNNTLQKFGIEYKNVSTFTENIDSTKVRQAIMQNVTSTEDQVMDSLIRGIQYIREKAFQYLNADETQYWEKYKYKKYYKCSDTLLDILMNEYKSCELNNALLKFGIKDIQMY